MYKEMKSDFEENFDFYLSERTDPYEEDNDFFTLARRVMGPVQQDQLRRLFGFKFTENDYANFPSWRTEKLERLIQDRVEELLG